MKGKKVLVTGGAGFIGSHLVEALVEEGAMVIAIDDLSLGKIGNLSSVLLKAKFRMVNFDICNAHTLEMFLRAERDIDLVYNLAVIPLPHSLEFPMDNFVNNTEMTLNLLEAQKKGLFNHLIHFSSSEVYGSARYAPMCEDHPLEASTPYAAAKASCDLLCLSYFRTFGNKVSILRPFNNYGPRQNSGAYAGVIPLTIKRIVQGENPVIYGNGIQSRDYIYVTDTAQAAITLGKRDDLDGEVFNIGSGHDIQIGWLIETIANKARFGLNQSIMGPIEVRPQRPGDVYRHIANCLKAKDILGFQHQIGMEEGLERTVKWYLDNSKNIF